MLHPRPEFSTAEFRRYAAECRRLAEAARPLAKTSAPTAAATRPVPDWRGLFANPFREPARRERAFVQTWAHR